MFKQNVTFSTGHPDVRPSIPAVLALLTDGSVDPLPVFSDIISFDDALPRWPGGCASPSSSAASTEQYINGMLRGRPCPVRRCSGFVVCCQRFGAKRLARMWTGAYVDALWT